jgi:hypothetical protein
MRSRRTIAATFLFLLFAATGGASHAQEPREKARQLIDEGVAKYDAGDYHAALDKFRAAYQTFPSPKIMLNIGSALRRLGREAEAADIYTRFLSEAAQRSDIDDERKRAAREALAELTPRLARLRMQAQPIGATLTLDGKPVTSTTGGFIYVAPGTHTVGAISPDYAAKSIVIEIAANEEKKVELMLQAVAQVSTTATSGGSTANTTTTTQASGQVDQPAVNHTWAWVAAGGAGALLLGGIIFGSEASSAYDEYKTTHDLQRYNDLRDEVSSKSTLANIFFITSGVAAVGAGVLYWWEGRAHDTAVSVAPGPNGSYGVTVAGRF